MARATPFDRMLRLFGDVRAKEGGRLLVLATNLFLLLLAYYLMKTVREPLVLAGGGAEVKSYASALQAILLVGIALAFGWIASRVRRVTLLTVVTVFFAANLGLFALVFQLAPRWHLALGVAFFIWVGCFSVMILAQFWAFANDLYDRPQGERLFGVIAGGSAIGALVGAKIAGPLFKTIGPYGTMGVAAGVLLLSLVLNLLVHHEHVRDGDPSERPIGALARDNGFSILARDRYLLFVGILSMLKNWINSTGEYILDRRLLDVARQRFADDEPAREAFLAVFKSDYFTYVNGIVLVLQFFAVSRLVRYLGVRRTLLVLPAIALLGYGTMAISPLLTVVLVAKIAENSADYSMQKTAEQMLFLVTSREAKYKVKAIVDTCLVRLGDVLSAATVWVGAHLRLPIRGFIAVNLGLLVVYTIVVLALGRAHVHKEQPARAQPHDRARVRALHPVAAS